MRIKLLLSLAVLLFISCNAHASPDFTQPLTLAELIDIALENHPSTKQAWWNARRAAAAVGSAKSLYYPEVALGAAAINGRDFKFINGPDTSYTLLGADLFVDLLLYDFGQRKATVDSAKASLLAANWQTDWNIQKVMVKVLENAYTLIHAQQILIAAEISLSEAERVMNAAKELNRNGLSPVSDVYITQATFSQMKMDLAMQKASLDIQRGKLAASIGFPATACLQICQPEPLPYQQAAQTDKLIEIAFQQRADLMAMQSRLQETRFNEAKTKTAYWPKLSFSGRAGYNHMLHDKSNGAQYRVALNFEAPLFTGFAAMYENRMAYADSQISTERLMELQLEVALEVLTSSRTLQAAQEMLPDAEENYLYAFKAYEGVLEKYRAGKEGITELSFAQRQLAAARVRCSEVRTKLLISVANLAYATGTLAPYMETPCN